MKKSTLALSSVAVCTLLIVSNRADAHMGSCGGTPASCTVSILTSNGFYDSPVSMTLTAGTDSFSLSGSNVLNFYNSYTSQFPGPNMQQQFTAKYFADIFGAGGDTLPHFSQQYFTQYPLLNTEAISLAMTVDGVNFSLSTAANSNTIVLNIPQANIHQTFSDTSRYNTLMDFSNWVKTNGNTLINELHNAIASHSAVDTVIGNPQSFVQTLSTATANFGTSSGETTAQGPSPLLNPAFSMMMEPQYYGARGVSGLSMHIPITYTWFLDDPRYAITLDVPLTYVQQVSPGSSVDTFDGAVGIGIRVPLTDHWYVTPQAHLGAVASDDSGTLGLGTYGTMIYSFAVRSKYNIFLDDDLTLSINNAGGYYHSLSVTIGKYALNPRIETGILSNGVSAETSSGIPLFGNPTSWRAYVLDNRMVGTHSTIPGWDEFGVSFGTEEGVTTQSWENLRFGMSLAVGAADYRAVELNLTVRF